MRLFFQGPRELRPLLAGSEAEKQEVCRHHLDHHPSQPLITIVVDGSFVIVHELCNVNL